MSVGSPRLPAVTLVARDLAAFGGQDLQLRRLVEGLLRLGHEVTVIAQTCVLESHPQLRVVRVAGPRRPAVLSQPCFMLLGSVQLARHRRGVVHTTGAIVLNRADVAVVHHCHHAVAAKTGATSASRPGRLYGINARVAAWQARLAERWCYRAGVVGRLVATSTGVVDELRTHFPAMFDHIELIPNGIDLPSEEGGPSLARSAGGSVGHRTGTGAGLRSQLGIPPRALLALFLGGDWERKGLSLAIRSLAHAPQWHLIVVGRGHRAGAEEVALRAGVTERVHFAGVVPEVAPFYAGADAFVLPSAYETFSLPAHEAAAAGLPLLVARVSGVEDIVIDGRNGWIVDRDPIDIGARLEALGSDAGTRCAMGRASREMVRSMSWAAMTARWSALYARLAAQGAPHSVGEPRCPR